MFADLPRVLQRPLDGEASAPQLPFRAFTIVGIVRDVRVGLGLFEMIDAGVYVTITPSPRAARQTRRSSP